MAFYVLGGALERNWFGPYVIHSILPRGQVQLQDLDGNILNTKYNYKHLKHHVRFVCLCEKL